MRAFCLLFLIVLAPAALAQAPLHTLPFPSATHGMRAPATHTIELALGAADGPMRVAVAAAPDWLAFETPSAEAVAGESEAVARLTFSVGGGAPVGEPAAVELAVTDGTGTERARHTVRLVVAAPELTLATPWPNPSRGAATVAFTVPEAGPARVTVVDVLGREVAVLADGEHEAGAHRVALVRRSLAAGTYAVVLRTEAGRRVERLTVVR